MNNVQLIGNLGNEPEIKTTTNGKKMAKFSIAAREAYTNAEGKRVENTQWFNLVAWESLASVAEKYLHKGKQVAICGKLSQRNWVGEDGQKKYITEVVVTDLMMLGKKDA